MSAEVATGESVGLSPQAQNLLGMSLPKLEQYFVSIGEKAFRARQVMKWVHQRGVGDFSSMTDISKATRSLLAERTTLQVPEVLSEHKSADGTRKWLMKVPGGSAIETVYIPDGERGTLCVSSQVGCSLDCSFCATGKQGFQRNLSAAEIIGQVWVAARAFGQFDADGERRITNVVMMGMGEPLLNFEPVVDAMSLMMCDYAYGISKRRVTLSTSGVVPALDQLGAVSDVSLAISLHAPTDALRDELVPINRKYPIATLLDSARRYIEGLPDNHRRITVEYTLIREVNDSSGQAHQLADLLADIPVKINLIPFNEFEGSSYRRVTDKALKRFQKILTERGLVTTIRSTRGDDIDAACGQLAGQVNDRTRRSAKYRDELVDPRPVRIIPRQP